MALAIFDLDNTLLGGDSDYLWGRYLAENAIVDPQSYHDTNLAFYNDYQSGQLDINAFLQFVFEPLAKNSMKDLLAWRADYLQQKILPIILPKGLELIEQHRQQGDTLLIITATNSFLTTPIAELLKIDNLIATDPEMLDGRYTGKVFGVPSFQHGKVERLQHWLDEHQQEVIFIAIRIMICRCWSRSIHQSPWILTTNWPKLRDNVTGKSSVCVNNCYNSGF